MKEKDRECVTCCEMFSHQQKSNRRPSGRGGGGVDPFADSAAVRSSVVSGAAGPGGVAVVHLLHSFFSVEKSMNELLRTGLILFQPVTP